MTQKTGQTLEVMPTKQGGASKGITVVRVRPGIGVAVTDSAVRLAQASGVHGLRTQGCTCALAAQVGQMDVADLIRSPRPQPFLDYVDRVLAEVESSTAGKRLVSSFARAPLPVRSGSGAWATGLGADQILAAGSGGSDSDIRVVLAFGQHGWDWWTTPGDQQRCQDGSGTWSLVSVPFQRTFTEGQFSIHPAVSLAHQLQHASQIHQGRFDPRVAKGVIQSWEAHHFSRRDMPVYEIEARGKPQQLRHLTLGAKESRSDQEPGLAERTRQAVERAEAYLASARGTASEACAVLALADRQDVGRISERTVAKELKLFYQGPVGTQQCSYEVTLWKSPAVLREALTNQARISRTSTDKSGNVLSRGWKSVKAKVGVGDKFATAKVSKPNPAEKYITFKPSGYELYSLAAEDIGSAGRDIKAWEDVLPLGSRSRAKTELGNSAIKYGAPIVGGRHRGNRREPRRAGRHRRWSRGGSSHCPQRRQTRSHRDESRAHQCRRSRTAPCEAGQGERGRALAPVHDHRDDTRDHRARRLAR